VKVTRTDLHRCYSPISFTVIRKECLRENKPLHRHTRFRRQELAQDEINPDVLAMSGHIARRCSEQKRVRIPAMKVSEWGHLLRALEIERVCH
jgi:hypothetical protein